MQFMDWIATNAATQAILDTCSNQSSHHPASAKSHGSLHEQESVDPRLVLVYAHSTGLQTLFLSDGRTAASQPCAIFVFLWSLQGFLCKLATDSKPGDRISDMVNGNRWVTEEHVHVGTLPRRPPQRFWATMDENNIVSRFTNPI